MYEFHECMNHSMSFSSSNEENPVYWPELGLIGHAFSSLVDTNICVYDDRKVHVGSFMPLNGVLAEKTVHLLHTSNNHFKLIDTKGTFKKSRRRSNRLCSRSSSSSSSSSIKLCS